MNHKGWKGPVILKDEFVGDQRYSQFIVWEKLAFTLIVHHHVIYMLVTVRRNQDNSIPVHRSCHNSYSLAKTHSRMS